MPLLQHRNSCLFPKSGSCNSRSINDLPPELLSRVFVFGTPNGGNEAQAPDLAHYWKGFEHLELGALQAKKDGAAEVSSVARATDHLKASIPFEIIICHVCPYWRDVALGTPSLWTLIAVSPDARPPYKHVSTLLQRSKTLPVDIHIDLGHYENGVHISSEDDDMLSWVDTRFLCSLLIPQLHRWHSVHVKFPLYQHIYEFFDSVSNPSISTAPHLKTLQLTKHHSAYDFERSWDVSSLKKFTLFGGSLPSIERLSLNGVCLDWNQPWIITSSTLTILELAYHIGRGRPSWTQFATMLRSVPQLKTLLLLCSGPSGEPADWVEPNTPNTHTPIHLPNLTFLAITLQTPHRVSGLFRRLSMPALKRLMLNLHGNDYTSAVIQLVGPATSLDPSTTDTGNTPRSLLTGLEEIFVDALNCTQDAMGEFLNELQNLKELHLRQRYSDTLLIILLGRCTFPGHDLWLPRLETLSVSGIRKGYRLIRDVVLKRKDIGVPIKLLRLVSSDIDDESLTWFTNNVESVVFIKEPEYVD